MASVGWAESVAEIKKRHRNLKKKKSCRNLEFSSETGKSCQKLENLAGNWIF